jgi:hypothetical protein
MFRAVSHPLEYGRKRGVGDASRRAHLRVHVTRDSGPTSSVGRTTPSSPSASCWFQSSIPMARCGLASSTRHITARVAKPCSKKASLRRGLSTSNGNTVISPRQVPLTLLHKTSKIVPQVLQYGPAAVKEKRSLDAGIWEKTLSNVYEDLSSSTPRPIRLAGMDSKPIANRSQS